MAEKIKNQYGLATLEIIFVMMTISIIASQIIPTISRQLNVASLDYETKNFISEFYFARTASKTSNFEQSIFSKIPNGKGIIFFVKDKSYGTRYSEKIIGDEKILSQGFKMTVPNNLQTISFDQGKAEGKSGTYILNSAKNSWYLILDSAGRIHASRVKKN